MIPISSKIEDKDAVNLTIIRDVAQNQSMILARVDALWHSEVILSTNDLMDQESIRVVLVLADEINTNEISYTGAGNKVYALKGSVFSSSDLFSVYIVDGSEQCRNCSVYRVIENGYFIIVTNSSDIKYHIVTVSNYHFNGDEGCIMSSDSVRCEMEFEKIQPYHVIAQISSNTQSNRHINVFLFENGRRTWYTLFIVLAIPIIISGFVLLITIFCICSTN